MINQYKASKRAYQPFYARQVAAMFCAAGAASLQHKGLKPLTIHQFS